MHGVSEVIAIILILMITITIAGFAYTFMSSTMSSTTSAASLAVTTTTSSMLTSFAIESVDANIIYIRNTGQNSIDNLSAYVNDLPVRTNVTPSIIGAGSVGTVAINDFVRTGDTIKISSPGGFSVSRIAHDQCYGSVGCWRFDEGTGTATQDSSANANDGSFVNIIQSASNGWAPGRFGGGIRFDGFGGSTSTNNTITIPNTASLNIAKEITVSLWAKISPGNFSYQTLIGKGLDHSWSIYLNKNPPFTIYLRVWNSTSMQTASTGSILSSEVWHHIVATYDGLQTKIYVNGTLAGNNSASGDIHQSTRAIGIGNAQDRSYWMNGTIDEVMIWDRALNDQEIIKLYNKAIY